jgi:hypothetical protein
MTIQSVANEDKIYSTLFGDGWDKNELIYVQM